MKASTKTASVSTSSKAASKASQKADTNEVQTVALPAAVQAAVVSLATADAAYQVASTSREKTIIVLGEAVQTSMASKHDYEVTRLSLKPALEQAFKASNKKLATPKPDKDLALYIGQQLARVMSVAYPGGRNATPSQRKEATVQAAKGKAAGLSQPKLLSLYSGASKLTVDKASGAPVLVPVKKDNRGGHNAASPLDAFTKAIHDAMTQAKVAGIDREQMLVVFADGFIALEMMDKETEVLTIATN